MMKEAKTKVVGFRVPIELFEKIEERADKMRRGSVAKVVQTIFIPAFKKELKKEAKTAATT